MTLPAAADSDRPIAIVVLFGKNTTADLIATVVAEAMPKNIGQKVRSHHPDHADISGLECDDRSSAEFAGLIASDRVKWTPIIKAANLSAE